MRTWIQPDASGSALALMLGLAGPITVDAETPPEPAAVRATGGAALPPPKPRRCCAALCQPRPKGFQSAHPVTPFPRGMAVTRPATIPRAGRVTITGRIAATDISSPASPVSAVAAAASTASPGRAVSAASTVSRVYTVQLGSAASGPGSDIWVALAGGNHSGTVNLIGRVSRI